MANDSHLFRTAAQLETAGFYPVEGNRWKKGEEFFVPLYEGKMVQGFDHRAASITNREGNLFRPGQPDRTLDDEHRDPAFSPRSRYWVSRKASTFTETHDWFLAFKDITASTNVRTMIAAVVPQVGCGHTLPVLVPAGSRVRCRKYGVCACQSQQLRFRLRYSPEGSSNSPHVVYQSSNSPSSRRTTTTGVSARRRRANSSATTCCG